MSQKQFQVRHNIPQVALQNTLQTSKAFGLRVSPINIIPLTTKADNNVHRRPILEDNHLDSNSKLAYEAHNKKLVPPLRKGLYSRANLDLDRKKELPSIEKLPKSAPNNLNARLYLKQGLRPQGMRISEDNKHRKPPLRRCEDKENDDLSGLQSMIDKEGLSTQRELKMGSQDDVMTEVTSSDGNTMINEGLKTKLSLEGADMKYNRKCRVGSRGQDNGSDMVEEDIFEEKRSGDDMDFTLAKMTPEKSGQRRELDTEDKDKEKPKKGQKSRRKDSILTNASTNSTRPESEVQVSQPAPAGVHQQQQRVRGAFTKEHIPLEDIKKKHEQKKVMREYLDTQLEEKKRFQAEEKARELEEQKREEERIKKESELLTAQGEVDPSALTFGRKRVAPPKKESISVQHSTVKRPLPRKRTEDDIQRVSNDADADPFNLDIDNIEPFISEGSLGTLGRKRILSGDGAAKNKETKTDVKELMKENDFLWGENQKKGELIDILIRALKQTDIPLNPLLSPPSRLHTEIPQDPESNRNLNFRSNPSKPQAQKTYDPPLLSQYFSQPSFPAEELLLKTQNITSTTNRKTRPYEYPTGFPAEDHKKIPDLTGFPMHTSKPFLPPHKPTVQKIQISLTRESHGYPPIKDLASPLRSPTLTNAILQPISVPASSKVLSNNNYSSNKSNNNNHHFYSHTRALTSPDEVLSVRMPLAQIPDPHNTNYGMSGSTRRAEQMHGHYNKAGYGENGMGTKSISHAHETFSKTNMANMDISGGNILVLEDGLNFARQDSKQLDGETEHLPSLKKAVRSEMNKEVEVEGLKALIPEFGRGKSSGALDQTARFPKEIFGINVKRKLY